MFSFRFHEIPVSFKENDFSKYKRYLQNLAEYLKDFFHRVQPLTDFSVIETQHSKIFSRDSSNLTQYNRGRF